VADADNARDGAREWDAALVHGLGLLLGRPLAEMDPAAEYVLYEIDTELTEDVWPASSGQEGGVQLPALARGGLVPAAGLRDYDLADGLTFDLSRSVWEVTGGWLVPGSGPLPPELAAAIREVAWPAPTGYGSWAVTAGDLARVSLEYPGDLSTVQWWEYDDGTDFAENLLIRVHTDGTLLDALRWATRTHGGPQQLQPLEPRVEVAQPWVRVLAEVTYPGLREHLMMRCLTPYWARSYGAHFDTGWATRCMASVACRPGHTPVAAWSLGEGQGYYAVFAVDQPPPGRTGM
jgi:hypothetical protein